MHVTAELRWFWPESLPDEWSRFFGDEDAHGTVPEMREERVDEYASRPASAADGETEVGLKVAASAASSSRHKTSSAKAASSESGIEGKCLVAVLGEVREGPFVGPVELWCKWKTEAAALVGERVRLRKERRVRVYDTSASGEPEPVLPDDVAAREKAPNARLCHVELTRITVDGDGDDEVAFTLAFEASGDLAHVREDLTRVLRSFAERRAPSLGGAILASVPSWLAARQR